MKNLLSKYNTQIKEATAVIRDGGVILTPTDTIWGLSCDASNEKAVEKIYSIKKRSDSKSLIILLDHDSKLSRYCKSVPEAAWDIIEYSDKPTTLILDDAYNIAKSVIASDGSVGIRICQNTVLSNVIRSINKPLVSTSANISGKKTASNFNQISNTIKESVDYILDIPELYEAKFKASSIIKIDKSSGVQIIRK